MRIESVHGAVCNIIELNIQRGGVPFRGDAPYQFIKRPLGFTHFLLRVGNLDSLKSYGISGAPLGDEPNIWRDYRRNLR